MAGVIEGKYLGSLDQIDVIHQIRKEVTGKEEPDLTWMFGEDTSEIIDEMACHAYITVNGEILGCGSLYFNGLRFVIGDVCVKEDVRRQLYGDFILRMLIDKCFRSGGREVVAYCDEEIKELFSKIGFEELESKDHAVKMRLQQGKMCTACGGHH